jgi:hypothetical protein
MAKAARPHEQTSVTEYSAVELECPECGSRVSVLDPPACRACGVRLVLADENTSCISLWRYLLTVGGAASLVMALMQLLWWTIPIWMTYFTWITLAPCVVCTYKIGRYLRVAAPPGNLCRVCACVWIPIVLVWTLAVFLVPLL